MLEEVPYKDIVKRVNLRFSEGKMVLTIYVKMEVALIIAVTTIEEVPTLWEAYDVRRVGENLQLTRKQIVIPVVMPVSTVLNVDEDDVVVRVLQIEKTLAGYSTKDKVH